MNDENAVDDSSENPGPDDSGAGGTGSGGSGAGGSGAGGSGAGGSGSDGDAPSTNGGGFKSPKVLAASALAAVLILLVAGFALTRGEDKPVVKSTTTTTIKSTTTTTTTEALPSGISEVATVKESLTEINVLAAPPAEWESAGEPVVPDLAPQAPPWSRDTAATRDPIPTQTSAVAGRYATPDGWRFENPGPYEPSQPVTFMVTERRGKWLKVLLPVRPNGTEGYISTTDVEVHQTSKRIELHIGEHRLVAYDGSTPVIETSIVTGVAATPTPTGTFFVTDVVPYTNASGFYGPYALATNGYSETIDEFDSGVPVIALHGTNRPELMGQDRSNGCIRVENDIANKLAADFGQGTPILIWP
ncbi:MAG TPA: L,D-transpeptidase [Microthrixaceae bacterium]|nr:L,D-transpeptidase [Microthrixaceae bacterium]